MALGFLRLMTSLVFWEVYWPNGHLKFRAEYKNVEEEGWTGCWWENGKLHQEGISEAGKCVGIWLS